MFEEKYLTIGKKILTDGETVMGRNGTTKQLFGETLKIDLQYGLPVITSRQMFYKGILGEFAALMNSPFDNISHFEKYGCNFWKDWADKNGNINVDYGNEANKPINKQGDSQMSEVVRMLKEDPHSRRIILNLWNPENVYNKENPLSLECCWFNLQFHVRDNLFLDIVWTQRSVDWAIGCPADMILASLYNIVIANQVGLIPGKIIANFGNVHLYEEHHFDFLEQTKREPFKSPDWQLNAPVGMEYKDFLPEMLGLIGYDYHEKIKYTLKK